MTKDTAAAMSLEAKRWLESRVISHKNLDKVSQTGPFDFFCLSDMVVSVAEAGRALCSYRVPPHVTDDDGNWQPGAIATMIDDVGATAINTTEGIVKISVDFDISFFSPAKIDEEVEIDARVMGHKGDRLSMVVVEVKKKGSGEMVALGRQWMSSTRPIPSKL